MKHIIEQLKNVGLNEKQAMIYIALVELGQSTAYSIALRSKIKRPTTYVILEELRRKGLVLKIPHAKKQLFTAKLPEEIFTEQEEKIRRARQILPDLVARVSRENSKARTLCFEGKEGIREALHYKIATLARKEMVCFYAKADGGSIPKIYFEHETKLEKQGTSIRALAPDHQSLKAFRETDKKFIREVAVLPQSIFSPNTTVEVTPDFVRIILHKSHEAVIIENNDFASTLKQIFEMLWKLNQTAHVEA